MPESRNIAEKLRAGVLRKTTFYASNRLLAQIKYLAAMQGRSMHTVIEEALGEYLKARPREARP